ncbi:hypothetical protein BCV69DRAFT_277855 [Microstroma glucosiphilum]|uniref:Uncharacterized protein n=1 Tax=Pseudomicrostroma glucosiphilum TaxID=1684307 RepID=A0A316U466_9BASI|nr:hypothetical protein BCV69DRAFT_277855 [Pseudomicrostroma glucosiphilum]PWN20066.1 hypothetical protein BCV69DRAFT_277855 [Pseudomicrostroma glucosiphilum]
MSGLSRSANPQAAAGGPPLPSAPIRSPPLPLLAAGGPSLLPIATSGSALPGFVATPPLATELTAAAAAPGTVREALAAAATALAMVTTAVQEANTAVEDAEIAVQAASATVATNTPASSSARPQFIVASPTASSLSAASRATSRPPIFNASRRPTASASRPGFDASSAAASAPSRQPTLNTSRQPAQDTARQPPASSSRSATPRRTANASSPTTRRSASTSPLAAVAATLAAGASSTALPPAAVIQAQRLKRSDMTECKPAEAYKQLETTRSQWQGYHAAPRPSTAPASHPFSAQILQQERAKRAQTPLEDAEAEAIWQLCPPIFETLAQGGPLAPLMDDGTLQTPNTGVTVGAVLQAFEEAHPVQRHWVAEAKRAPNQITIRYAGICIDGEPAWRLEQNEDSAEASEDSSKGITTTRILKFMSKFSEQGIWRTYAVPILELPALGPTRIPLQTLVDSYGWICASIAPTTLPLAVTRQMRLKQSNAVVAPREAALIHCGAIGSPMLNSASHGGLGTLDGVGFPPRVQALRLQVAQACSGPRPPLGGFGQEVLERIAQLFRSTAAALSLPVASHIIASTTLYAAAPGRSFHILKDVTAEDIAGEATRFGAFAGPGLSSFRNAMAWATGQRSEGESLELMGPSADIWPFAAPRMDHLVQYCALLRDLLTVRKKAGCSDVLVIRSGDGYNCLITRRGLSSRSPDHSPGSMKTEAILQEAGTLHVIEVGEDRMPSIVVFHAGCIKYNGDYMVERDLQVLCGLVVLKYLILLKHVRPRIDLGDSVAAAQAESHMLGLEGAGGSPQQGLSPIQLPVLP